MGKIVKLCEKDDDAKRFTPVDALKSIIKDYESGRLKGSKLVIVCLNDIEDNDYILERTMTGMHGNEARSLLQAAQYLYLRDTFQ